MATNRGPLAPDVLACRYATNEEHAFHHNDSHELLILCDTICRYAKNVYGVSMTHEGIKRSLFEKYDFPTIALETRNEEAQSLIDQFRQAISICYDNSCWDPNGEKEADLETGESRSAALCQIKNKDFSSQMCIKLKEMLDKGVVEVVRSGLVAEEEYE